MKINCQATFLSIQTKLPSINNFSVKTASYKHHMAQRVTGNAASKLEATLNVLLKGQLVH
jgi:hypothetical protein